MLATVSELSDYTLEATDGEIGYIDELYFQQSEWQIRYLVIGLGNWFTRQHVLLVPDVVNRLDTDLKKIVFDLTRQQIKDSPDVLSQLPVSREKEMALHRYYQWQPYWMGHATEGITYGTNAVWPRVTSEVDDDLEQEREVQAALAELGDESEETRPFLLRSTREVSGYYIQAADGQIGHVEDFMVDIDHWRIRYLVVDTRNWLPGRKVLVAADWIQDIEWQSSEVRVALTKESIENSPEYQPGLVSREYEAQLYAHYAQPSYWDEGWDVRDVHD
jgi:sporulation protein YlmC with PRC-barrel domain